MATPMPVDIVDHHLERMLLGPLSSLVLKAHSVELLQEARKDLGAVLYERSPLASDREKKLEELCISAGRSITIALAAAQVRP